MKKALLAATFIVLTFVSCSSDDPIPVPADTYMNFSAGARWNYENIDNVPPASTTPYSLTSTSRDTMLGGRQYHIFENSLGGFEFYSATGTDHYSYFTFPDPINAQAQNLYLKASAPVGTSWQAATIQIGPPLVPVTLNVVMTNTIVEKGITKVVNGITYTNVIHVSSTVTIPGVPGTPVTSDIHNYYALRYGLISGTMELSSTLAPITVDTETKLMSANF